MTVYAADHASAHADLVAAGSAVTFTRSTLTQDPTTGEPTGQSTASVAGFAIRVKGNPIKYAALGLTATENVSLLFSPTTIGTYPALDASVTWGGLSYSVKDVEPIAPDGTALLARVVVAR